MWACDYNISYVPIWNADDSSAGRNRQINTTRYLTYFGLCVATCIIFQKNIAIASVIGVAVGVYIAASEYLLSGTV